jgi:hypothetical protein
MKRALLVLIFFLMCFAISSETIAQCSICTKTAQQMGEGPAKGLNSAILYLMVAPFGIVGFIAYRWLKGQGIIK